MNDARAGADAGATVTVHMVASLDGYVAKQEESDVSWMDASWSAFEQGVEMSMDVLATIDCYVMGSRTYELALRLGWPYGETRCIVMTRQARTSPKPSVEFHPGGPEALVQSLAGQNVWVVGGPSLCQAFLRLHLVDQLCVTLVPTLLGGGMPFFGATAHRLRLKEVSPFKNGMIDLWYHVLKD